MTGPTVDKVTGNGPRRLHLNECPLPPPPHILEAIGEAARELHHYPPIGYAAFLEKLSAYAKWPASRIVLANGSDEILHTLPVVAANAQAETILAAPSFPTFKKVADLHGIASVSVPVDAFGVPDVEAILQAVSDRTRLVCIASPNNPTGGLLSEADLKHLAGNLPAHCVLHLDEAYFEFGQVADGPDALSILEGCSFEWVVSRSFSKAFGLAGIRLGYALCSSERLAGQLRKATSTFNANALAIAAAEAGLQNPDAMRARVEEISAERERLATGLAELGLSPLPSAANFIAVPVPFDCRKLVATFAAAGLLVGSFSLKHPHDALRITVGTADDSNAVLQCVRDFRLNHPDLDMSPSAGLSASKD